MSEWAGGPSGRHARSEWLLRLGPLAVAATLPIIGAVLRLQWCLAHGWSGREPYVRMCYSDLANSVQSADLEKGLTAYLSGDLPLDQPPLSGAVMAFLGGLLGRAELLSAQRWFIGLWAALAFGLIVLMISRTRTIADHPGADPVMLALAPVTVLTVLVSPDILGVALATLGIWAWSTRRPTLAGVMIGLGTLARSYPVLVLAVIALLALRPDTDAGRRPDLVRTFATFAGTMLIGGGIVLSQGDLLWRFFATWWRAPAGLGALAYAPTLGGLSLTGPVASAFAMAGWAVALVVGGYFVTSVRRPPTLAAGVLVVVAIVILTGKSYPVQAALWLVPLVALAGIRWRDVLIWCAAESAHFVALWLYLAGLDQPTRGLPAGWYLTFLVARLAAVAWLAGQAWVDAPRLEETPEAGPTVHGSAVDPDRVEGLPVPALNAGDAPEAPSAVP